jgi:hypothetical protein
MTGLYFLLPVFFTIFVSFLIVRAAAIALRMTGLDKKRAVFQALSAFTGTGFTTKEAESVINHPLRRKIITWLMIMGNAGIVTIIITATSSIVTSKGYSLPIDIVLLFIGILVIYKIGTSHGFIRKWETYIENKLVKSPHFEEEATEDLLHLLEGYGLVRATIKKDSPLADISVSECKLCREDILLLGIEREKNWIPIPKKKEKIKEGDRLVVYGNLKTLKNIL